MCLRILAELVVTCCFRHAIEEQWFRRIIVWLQLQHVSQYKQRRRWWRRLQLHFELTYKMVTLQNWRTKVSTPAPVMTDKVMVTSAPTVFWVDGQNGYRAELTCKMYNTSTWQNLIIKNLNFACCHHVSDPQVLKKVSQERHMII